MTVWVQPHRLNCFNITQSTSELIFMNENLTDPLKVAGNVYKLNMENDRVRVLNLTLKPGDKAVMHHHPDHVVYVLKGGKGKLTSQDKTDVLDMKTGEVTVCGPHRLNCFNTTQSIGELFLMNENMLNPLDVASNVYKFKMENDRVRVLNATFKPGNKAVMHHHPDHLVYVLVRRQNETNFSRQNDILELKLATRFFLRLNRMKQKTLGKQHLNC